MRTLAERLWAKVDRNGPLPPFRPELGNCWLWTARATSGGTHPYGRIHITPGAPSRGAHIVAWELENGLIPEGMHLDHLCRVTLCCRPSHAEVVPPGINTARGAQGFALTGRCKSGRHEIRSDADVRISVSRGVVRRSCRACNQERNRRR